MNSTQTQRPDRDDKFVELYRQLNRDHAQRRDALLQQLPTVTPATIGSTSTDTSASPRRRGSRRWWLTSAAVMTAMLIAGIVVFKPRDAWADVVKAVRLQKWIHFVHQDDQGNVDAEHWESPSAEISASKSATEIRLADTGTSLMQVYDPATKKVVRLELKDQDRPEPVHDFIGLLLGHAEEIQRLQVTNREQRSVTEGGQSWDELRVTIQPFGGMPMLWIVKIDPTSHLPQTLRAEVDGKPFPGTIRFDYPAEGPSTLAALGVPEDAEVEDRIPKDSLKIILAEMRTQRRKFGAYYLRMADERGQCRFEIWKDGLKWRQDLNQPEVCDGREWWTKTMGYWERRQKISAETRLDDFCRLNPQWNYLENLAYPSLASTPTFDLSVQTNPADGPEGCVLVERTARGPIEQPLANMGRLTYRKERYWLDPTRGYVLVKRVLTDVAATDEEARAAYRSKHLETTHSDFQRSPEGAWYPTVIKTTGSIWVKQIKPTLMTEPLDQHWRLTADFKTPIPNETFNISEARNRM